VHGDVHQEERLKAWADFQPGDFVALADRGGTVHAGIVEDRTADGLIIWIRTELNERKLFHLEDGLCACRPTCRASRFGNRPRG
jgi:hypothetical protein